MAKKVVVPENNENGVRVKRKRSRCCTCCVVFAISNIVLLAVIFCVGWFLGDKYTKQYLGLSMKDTMGIVSGLYWTKDKDVVKNPYSDEDLNGFYGEIKTNALLKEDAEIDFSKSLDAVIKNLIGGGANGGAKQKSKYNADLGYEETAAGESGAAGVVSSVSDVFTDMVVDVFTRDNIDLVKLENYSEEHDEYVFALNDKGLAAFINEVLGAVLDSGAVELPDVLSGVKLSEAVSLKQVRFKAESSDNELGESIISATTVDVTLWLGLQDTAGKAATGLLENNGVGYISGFTRWLLNVMLPENLYVTVTLPLKGEADPQVTLNDMSDAKRDNTYKLVDGILSLSGSSQTVRGLMTDVAEKIKPMIEAIADKADFDSAARGTIKFDFLGSLANLASKSLSPSDPLTKADFMYMLQALLATDPAAKRQELKPYLYKGWYRLENDASAAPEYDPADKSGKIAIDYTEELKKEIAQKYCIDFGDAPLGDVLSMLGISLNGNNTVMGSSELLNKINAARFKTALDADISTLDLEITDRMLAAVFDAEINGLLTGNGSAFGGLTLAFDAITFVERADKPGHVYALLAVEVNVEELVGKSGNGMLGKLASNVLPETMLISIISDITPNTPEGFERDAARFEFNDCKNTDRVISALYKLIPSLDLKSLSERIDTMLRDMIAQLYAKLPDIRLVPSVAENDVATSGEFIMPNIFKLVSGMVLLDEEKKPIVTDEEFKNVLRCLNDTSGMPEESNIAENYSGFLSDVTDKYYLKVDSPLSSFDDLTKAVSNDMGKDKFRFDGSADSLIYDVRTPAELKPTMSAAELGALLKEKMTGDAAVNQKFEIKQVSTADDVLEIILTIKLADIMPTTMQSLITADAMFVTVSFDVSTVEGDGTEQNPYAYKVALKINGMDEKTHSDALKIVNALDKSVNIENQVKQFGRILYSTFDGLKKQMDEKGNLDGIFSFTENGLELTDFYTFLGGKLGLDMKAGSEDMQKGYTALTLKKAIQGMYQKSDEFVNPDNYDKERIIRNQADKNATLFDVSASIDTDGTPDKKLNAVFGSIGSDVCISGGSKLKADQTVALAENAHTEEGGIRDWLKARISNADASKNLSDGAPNIDDGKSYLYITFILSMDCFMGYDSTETGSSFIPPTASSIYVTVVYENTTDENFKQVGIVFGDMETKTYELMYRLMGLNAAENGSGNVNISTIAGRSAEVLNAYFTGGRAEITPLDNPVGGIGKVKRISA